MKEGIGSDVRMTPAPWVSWRTYPIKGEHRSLILNQRTREYLLLEDDASALWQMLTERQCAVWEVSSKFGFTSDDLSEFAAELGEAGVLEKQDRDSSGEAADPPSSSSSADLEQEMLTWTEQRGFIFAAHWETTYRCNQRCIHCYNPGAAHQHSARSVRSGDELTTDEGKRLLDDLVELGVFRLTLSGGEFSVRRDFVELMEYARQLGFQVVLFTNGLRFPEPTLERISRLHPDAVEVSVYSADAALHDAITGVPGSHERALRTLRYFRAWGVRTVFKTSLTRDTIRGWRETLALGERCADTVILNPIISPGVDGDQAPLLVQPEFDQLVQMAAASGNSLSVGDSSFPAVPLSPMDPNQSPCGAGHGSIAITPSGDIWPCVSLPIRIGNFRSGDIRRLRGTTDTQGSNCGETRVGDPRSVLEAWRKVRIGDLSDCGTHDYCGYCGDICPGDALIQTGDPRGAPQNHCRVARARKAASRLSAGAVNDRAMLGGRGRSASCVERPDEA